MNTKILEDIGFTKNETKVYLALLELGICSVTKISAKSKVNRTNIYDCLNKLLEKGVVSYIMTGDTKLFEAANPQTLLNLLKEKEMRLNSILPELIMKDKLAEKKSSAQIFEGVVALRNMMNHFLDKNEDRFAYGGPNKASQVLSPHFLTNYHNRRVEKKITFNMIYNSDVQERRDFLNRLDYTEARFLPQEFDSPVTTTICGDEVVLFLYADNPLIIQIKNAEIAKAYKRYFDILWDKSK